VFYLSGCQSWLMRWGRCKILANENQLRFGEL
jgi:hypothetical protein